MLKSGPAAVLLSNPELRTIALAVLEERGYGACAVDREGAIASIRAGNLALVEFGPGGVGHSEVLAAHQAGLLGLSSPILAAVDPADAAAAGAALAAGATMLVPVPFDRVALAMHLSVSESWAGQCTRFGRLLEQLPNRIMVFDADGRLAFVNRSGPTGPVDELMTASSVAELPRELRDAVEQAAARARETGEPSDQEVQASGVWFLLRVVPLAPGEPDSGFALVTMDITQHRRAEAELRASNASATALLDALPDMMFRLSAAGVYLDAHAERADMLAVPPDQIIGRSVRDIFGARSGARAEELIGRALSTGEVQRYEFRIDKPDGMREYEARMVAIASDEVVAIVRDVTETKLLQARLAVADRMAALGTLSAGVAHEINNPLTYILIGIESVLKELRRCGPGEPIGERFEVLTNRLDGAMEGARRVRRIVSDLRTFGQADEQEERLIDPRVVLDAAAAMVDSHIRYRARLVRDYQEVPQIIGNHDRLVQVFVNLLLNAAQSVDEREASRNVIRLGTRTDDDGRVAIEVEDSGEGIAVEDLGRIFDPFFTTKPVGEGTGLGLWVCHSIVTGHGGSISVHSRRGEGTTFRVLLPGASRVVESDVEKDVQELLALASGRILIIDDDTQVAHSLAILFEGCDITVLNSGHEAVKQLASGASYDWIFCDLMMPDLSGMDVYEQASQAGLGLESRFVFMTGGIFTPRARDFVARVPNPCLSKPFHPRQVVAALRQAGPARPRGR